jgi:hypothetical protein
MSLHHVFECFFLAMKEIKYFFETQMKGTFGFYVKVLQLSPVQSFLLG